MWAALSPSGIRQSLGTNGRTEVISDCRGCQVVTMGAGFVVESYQLLRAAPQTRDE